MLFIEQLENKNKEMFMNKTLKLTPEYMCTFINYRNVCLKRIPKRRGMPFFLFTF